MSSGSNPRLTSRASISLRFLTLAAFAFLVLLAVSASPGMAQDACVPNPCLNGGQCSGEGSTFFGCRCFAGFEGEFCEIDTTGGTCEPNPCLNGGTCNDLGGGSFSCSCPAGTTGANCETILDPCDPNPCLNGATCDVLGVNEFACRCEPGFGGTLCEIENDPCQPNPCLNDGICLNEEGGGFSCQCQNGYSGEICETGADPCNPNPCQNGGLCDSSGTILLGCRCRFGFEGEFCEIAIDLCDPNPCQNGGTCSNNGDGSTSCECPEGFSGELCETPDGPCTPDPCQNGGICITDGTTFFGCSCQPPWTGTFCEVSSDPCDPDPCSNGGLCQDDGIDFLGCVCEPGFGGATCAEDQGLTFIGSVFDEGEGTTTDFRQGLVGILGGGAGFSDEAQGGSSVLLDGTGYVEVADAGTASITDFPNAFTITLWARPDALGGNQMLVSKDNSFELEVGKVADSVWDLRINNAVVAQSSVHLDEEVWQHLAVSWDGSTVSFYHNGQPAGGGAFAGIAADNNNSLGVGGRPSAPADGGPVFLFDGAIDDVRIYGATLDASQIADLVAVTVVDQTAPVLSNPLPVSPVTAGTALTLGVTTDDLATCRTSPSAGVAFDDMFLELTRSGNNHTLAIGSAAADTINHWYVRCRDLEGNTHNEDLVVAFVAGNVDLVTNLLAFWPLDEGSGCVAGDASGFNDGTLGPDCLGGGDAPLWTAALNGTGLAYDGANDEVRVSADAALDTPGALTIAAWIHHGPSGIFRSIVDRRDSGADGYDLYLDAQSRLFLRVDDGVLVSNTVVADGTWHHVAGTYDGNTLRLYVDGVLDASVAVGAKAIDVAADLFLGRNFAGTDFGLAGTLDEVMIYGRALSATEVFQTYLSTQP